MPWFDQWTRPFFPPVDACMHSSAEHVLDLTVEITSRAPFVSCVLCIKIVRSTQISN